MKLTKTGIAFFTAALMVSTSALAEQAKQEGVIIAHTNDGLNIRTRQGPLHVVMSPDTTIQQVKGLSKKLREGKDLMNGLIITVEGDQQGNSITAKSVRFRESDWRNAVAAQGATQQQFSDLRKAIIEGNEYVIQQEVTVYFPVGSAVISAQSQQELLALAQKAPSYGNYRLSILGFADPTGNAAANQQLSAKRAMAVNNYLRQSGKIQPGRVLSPSAMGEGTTAPGEAAPANNNQARRVVVRVVTPKGQLK